MIMTNIKLSNNNIWTKKKKNVILILEPIDVLFILFYVPIWRFY